ncbi:hypothetical protein P692DRAFT_20868775 [Suillus brevipes Sb2]|nr:hypothetical protein P692DRAFT_20868775 [Suillus brevipes Sb2]
MVNITLPAGRSVPSHEEVIALNLAITSRNLARKTRRDQGDINVENDEALLPVPPIILPANTSTANVVTPSLSSTNNGPTNATPSIVNAPPAVSPVGPNPRTPITDADVLRMINSFQSLTPSKRVTVYSAFNQAMSVTSTASSASTTFSTPLATNNVIASSSASVSPAITNALLPSTDPASIIFDVNHERPSTTSLRDSYGIHTYILELAKYHQHIPLTLLTSKATTRLFIESSSLKFITHYSSHRNAAPSKCHLIDVSQFPAENSINIPDWHEAWTRYLLLLTNHASPAVLTRWFDHYTALREHPDFSDNWSSILAFDIEQRAAYAADPQAFNEAKYFRQFDNIKIRILKDENLKAMNDHFAHFKNHRFEPYPQPNPALIVSLPSALSAAKPATPSSPAPPTKRRRARHRIPKSSTNNSCANPPPMLNIASTSTYSATADAPVQDRFTKEEKCTPAPYAAPPSTALAAASAPPSDTSTIPFLTTCTSPARHTTLTRTSPKF